MPASLPRRHALKLFGGAAALGTTMLLGRCAATRADAGDGDADGASEPVGMRSTVQDVVTGPLRVGAWAAAPVAGDTGRASLGFTECTLRLVVRASVGGIRPRIRLSNLHGKAPLLVESASIGVRLRGAQAAEGTLTQVLFDGERRAVVPAGQELFSDPVSPARPIAARDVLLVSLYLPGPTGPATWHPRSQDATWIASGDRTWDGGTLRFTKREIGWYYLTGLDLVSTTAGGTVVCFGDSITDGSSPALTRPGGRWPDALAARIAKARPDRPLGVVDLGIASNRLLTDRQGEAGRSALTRFRGDALTQPGLTDVILLEGINDIGSRRDADGRPLTADELIAGYRTLIGQARAAGAAVHGGTLTPFQGATYYSDFGEQIRQRVNQWIRTGGAFDSVVDFERAVRDPRYPGRYRPGYDIGDRLHPSDTGYRAMAAAVDLAALRG
ncbi:SGNH/GDSL hydrolase family protein [Peterkaempfera bronchialis]|uniref:SGNH/GDSL hydrolase family protein n=1 Tax=Peterkaempfera bronchialis TaxID=2126346 RepID=UPI003C2B0761